MPLNSLKKSSFAKNNFIKHLSVDLAETHDEKGGKMKNYRGVWAN